MTMIIHVVSPTVDSMCLHFHKCATGKQCIKKAENCTRKQFREFEDTLTGKDKEFRVLHNFTDVFQTRGWKVSTTDMTAERTSDELPEKAITMDEFLKGKVRMIVTNRDFGI